jgi:hypothetical protein
MRIQATAQLAGRIFRCSQITRFNTASRRLLTASFGVLTFFRRRPPSKSSQPVTQLELPSSHSAATRRNGQVMHQLTVSFGITDDS